MECFWKSQEKINCVSFRYVSCFAPSSGMRCRPLRVNARPASLPFFGCGSFIGMLLMKFISIFSHFESCVQKTGPPKKKPLRLHIWAVTSSWRRCCYAILFFEKIILKILALMLLNKVACRTTRVLDKNDCPLFGLVHDQFSNASVINVRWGFSYLGKEANR